MVVNSSPVSSPPEPPPAALSLPPTLTARAASSLPATMLDTAVTGKQHAAGARPPQQTQQQLKEAVEREKTWLSRPSEQPSPQPQAPTPPDEQDLSSPLMLTTRKSPASQPDNRNLDVARGMPSGKQNQNLNVEEVDMESELSEPGTNVQSPVAVGINQLEDEIVVGARANQRPKYSLLPYSSSDENQEIQEIPDVSSTSSHYPKRKCTATYSDLNETRMEATQYLSSADEQSLFSLGGDKPRRNRQSLGPKSVVLGHWRDSDVPDDYRKHAVIGFIDIRDRLRTRIQPMTKDGESLGDEYPLPPGPGASWVTFERIVFSDHLVGLDQVHIKEYTRIRAATTSETTVEERQAAELSAVQEAKRRVRKNPLLDNVMAAPLIACGPELPEGMSMSSRTEVKRRRISGGPSPSEAFTPDSAHAHTPQPMAAHQTCFSIDPLPGTRPTRILLGYWKSSSELDVKDRHAVYGILGQNDMFRVKVVRETRDGRFVDGNFPTGAGALWISYDEVEFEDHLKSLARPQVKEYCRIRQYQLDHGEREEDRIENETKAVLEAQTRAGTLSRQPVNMIMQTLHANSIIDPTADRSTSGTSFESRASRLEPRPEGRLLRQSLNENELRATQPQLGDDSFERTSAMARREIARVEAAQGRADRHALNRERAVAAATDAIKAAAAAAAAAVAPTSTANGRGLFHESDDVRRLNGIWARQESLRMRAVSEDAKMYDGVKYERKSNGPFTGKLVSQGTLINIDGEDFVEYRVLTKPSFF